MLFFVVGSSLWPDLIVKTTAITQFEGVTTEYTPSVIGSILHGIDIWAYTALQESSRIQATLGKRMLEIKVTDLGGGGAAHRLNPGKSYTRLGDIA